MAKTKETITLERAIYRATVKQGVFGCFEVTIGWFGKERVDFMTYDTRGDFRCYEIKVTKSDFHSKANNSFVGDLNYYVMTSTLYEQVKDEIPDFVGVHTGQSVIKKPKRIEKPVSADVLKDSIIRSLARDADKIVKSRDQTLLQRHKQEIQRLERDCRECHRRRINLENAVRERYGREVLRELLYGGEEI